MHHYGLMAAVSKTLADNLERIRLADADHPSQAAFARRLGLQQRTYNRIIRCEVDASLETLETMATALKLHPWQLLVEDFNPATPPQLAVLDEREAEFYALLRQAAKRLPN